MSMIEESARFLLRLSVKMHAAAVFAMCWHALSGWREIDDAKARSKRTPGRPRENPWRAVISRTAATVKGEQSGGLA
jgi:hypothetical protein